MGCLGVHFALTEKEVERLRSFDEQRDRLDHLQEEIEEDYFSGDKRYIAESDKAWDAMHRALTDGTLNAGAGTYPLSHVIYDGESLYNESDYIMILKTPKQVKDIAAEIARVSETNLREGYFKIDPADYGFPVTEEDFSYTWHWFQNVRELYKRAAEESRYVLFTASQ